MSGFSFYNSYNSTGRETDQSRRRRNAPTVRYQPLSTYRPYSYEAQARRRRYFGDSFGSWLNSPSGMLATRRISSTNRPFQPGRPQMRGQRYVNPSQYTPNRWYFDNEYNPLPGSGHDTFLASRTQRFQGQPSRRLGREGSFNTAARHGQMEYNAVRRDLGNALNPSYSTYFSDYNDNLRYRDYQHGIILDRLRNRPFNSNQG